MTPDPDRLHPLQGQSRLVLLRPLAEGRANVAAGRFSYYDDPDRAEAFFDRNVLYHFDFIGDRLEIGDFCAIATDARFIMNGAAHAQDGFSTFPFNIFGDSWAEGFDPASWIAAQRGDTVVGADVWIGREALVMPGARIGPGAIIAARAVVTGAVRPYAVMAGNPAREIRRRFDDATIDRLLALAWWDWPLDAITSAVNAIRGADLDALEALRP